MAVAAKKVSAWDFDRVIPCHGDVIETGGKHGSSPLFVISLGFCKLIVA